MCVQYIPHYIQLALKSNTSKIKTESTHLFKVLRDGKQAFWPRAVWAVSEASLGNLVLQPDQESYKRKGFDFEQHIGCLYRTYQSMENSKRSPRQKGKR